jgi:hypothetical protein
MTKILEIKPLNSCIYEERIGAYAKAKGENSLRQQRIVVDIYKQERRNYYFESTDERLNLL